MTTPAPNPPAPHTPAPHTAATTTCAAAPAPNTRATNTAATHGASKGDRPPIRDQRHPPRGVLPRQLQTWLMVALALVILAIILATGHATPPPRPVRATRPPESGPLATDQIEAYKRQLADDQRQFAADRAALHQKLAQQAASDERASGADGRGGRGGQSRDPLADDRRRRDYESLFAGNVAFTHRPADTTREPTTPGAGAWSPEDLLRLQALAAARQIPEAPAAAIALATPDTGPGHAPSRPSVPSSPSPSSSPSRPSSPSVPSPLSSPSIPSVRLLEGTVIETVLLNRLDGTFAGPVECLVTTPLYTRDRQQIVIPAGARLLGTASPVQSWGDSRLAVSFHRLVMPDGRAYTLDQFKGLDQAGATGLRDEINRHYLQVFGASAAIGALSGLAQYGSVGGLATSRFSNEYRQAAGASLATSAGRVLDRYLNVLPTLTIREGVRIKVFLTSDVDLPIVDADGDHR